MTAKSEVRVVEFDESLAKAFADLNYAWIEEDYCIEQHDRDILDHPESYVIDAGGQIFFAVTGKEVAGTVALLRTNESTFELAKMAVDPEYQGRGISNLLMKACIKFAENAGAKSIFLESNTKQAAAINLYRKFGFIETPLDPNSPYSRVNIRMERVV